MVCFSECCLNCLLIPVFMLIQTGVSCQWTTDSQRLMLEHFDMINISPSFIYSSALPFSPSSWLHQHYSSELVKIVRGLSGWGTCLCTIPLGEILSALACYKDIIAVGSNSGKILILNAITGGQITILSGHTSLVASINFSLDGTSLVSGSRDKTIRLWDLQTGGVVRTFQGHTDWISSVSISLDCTRIASGSYDETICLWNVQTGECCHIIQQENYVDYVQFFPLDPQHLISISGRKCLQWDIDGHQITPAYNGSHAAFSPDGTKFALCHKEVAQIYSSDSIVGVAELCVEDIRISCCCFSPDSKLFAVADYNTAYLWDITDPDPCLIETFIGHSGNISLAFSSPTTLVSASWDESVKFWQVSASSLAPAGDTTGPNSMPLTSPIKSITLQAEDGVGISSDSEGIVRIWDLPTGLCKASFQTPVEACCQRDVQLINHRLIIVWHIAEEVHIWDVEEGKQLQMVNVPWSDIRGLRIAGDGSKVFCLYRYSIQALSTWTGRVLGEVGYQLPLSRDPFMTIDGSRVWVRVININNSWPYYGQTVGWDFGDSDLTPIKECTRPPNRFHLDFIGGIRKERSSLPRIEDTITGKEVLQLPWRYVRPADAQWNGQYLVAGYDSGEVLILECNCTLHH